VFLGTVIPPRLWIPGSGRAPGSKGELREQDGEGWHYIDLEDLLGFDSS
jgi:hypothetical protein